MTTKRLILAGVDLGPRAAVVLAGAWEMAQTLDADLTIAHCLRPHELGDLSEAASINSAALDAEMTQRQRRLDALVAAVLPGLRAPRVLVEVGEPVSSLLTVINRWSPSVVVLGGQRRWLPLCGVAEKVSRLCPVPVLLIPTVTPTVTPTLPQPAVLSAPPRPAQPHLRLVR